MHYFNILNLFKARFFTCLDIEQEGMIRAFSISGHISQVKFNFLLSLQSGVNREMDQISGDLCHSPK